jgi:hypothetical protein
LIVVGVDERRSGADSDSDTLAESGIADAADKIEVRHNIGVWASEHFLVVVDLFF